MLIKCLDEQKNLQIITIDYVGWETDAYANETFITGVSFFSSDLNQSYLIETEDRTLFNTIIDEIYDTGKASVALIARPYGDDGSFASMMFGN